MKQELIDNYDDRNKNLAQGVIEAADIICIFGASLKETDRYWKDIIREWLLDDRNHHLVRCHKDGLMPKNPDISRFADDLDDAKDALMEEFEFDAVADEKIRKQLHVPIGHKIFNFEEVIFNGGEDNPSAE